MDRVYLSDTSDTPPTPPTRPARGYPQDGNLSTNTLPTAVGAWWFHMMTEEQMALLAEMGVEPDLRNNAQLAEAFRLMKARQDEKVALAKGHADRAGVSETNAATSEANAKASETVAVAKASEAKASAANAKSSETIAIAKANEASASATSALASETIATTKASEASVSATNALNSETASASSASQASTSESAAKTSETNALASANKAESEATKAKASEIRAVTAETNAKSSETIATAKANEASTSATNAATSATSSASSATQAAASASEALKSKISAGTSEANAKASELAAANSAQQAAVSAETSLDKDVLRYNPQTLTPAQQSQARLNIDACSPADLLQTKNDLLNGAGQAYDTLKELGDLIDDNHDAIDALEIIAGSHISYSQAQDLTDDQKAQARANIGVDSTATVEALQSKVTSLQNELTAYKELVASTYLSKADFQKELTDALETLS